MIDVADIPNWTRWAEKEQSGINRGYPQAYINQNRADHFVLISKSDLSFDDEYKVTVKPYTNGDWKPDWSSDNEETFTGHPAEKDDLIAQAEAFAREWMLDHPCERGGDTRTAAELLTDIITAIRGEGLVPQHDAGVNEWTKAKGSTGFSLMPLVQTDDDEVELADDPRNADVFHINIEIDGKASGLSYRETTEYDSDGESRRKHDPKRPKSLFPKLEAAFEAIGFDACTVKDGGHQRHWDYAKRYTVLVFVPDDFEFPSSNPWESRRQRGLFMR